MKRDEYDKSVSELKKHHEEITERRQKEHEKTVSLKTLLGCCLPVVFTERRFAQLTEVFNKGEKEKFDMQKQHTKAFQDLVEETNMKLKRVECEYNEQQSMNDKVILEMENKAQLLRNEMEKYVQLTSCLEKDKRELAKQIEMLDRTCAELTGW